MAKKELQREEFPYDQFPWKLIHKDGKENRTCYFQTEDHMKKHIQKYKLNKKQIKISHKSED